MKYFLTIVAISGLLSAVFYWYEYRPAKASEQCAQLAAESYKEPVSEDSIFGDIFGDKNEPPRHDEAVYTACMRSKGFSE